jgi:AraC-like DNA-binding protein
VGDGFLIRSLAMVYGDGFVVGEHAHPWGQLVYSLSGVMHVAAGDLLWLVPPTRAIWLPAGQRHRIVMQGRVSLRTLYVAPGLARALPGSPAALEVAPLLREMILHALERGMLGPRGADARLAAVLVDLIARARPEDLALPLPRDRRALALADRLRAAPHDRGGVADLARDAGASPRTLQRLFPRETGLSIDAWRRKARLIHAVAALSSGASVTAAALDCGFDGASAFITAFRRQFGVTPGRYRPGREASP